MKMTSDILMENRNVPQRPAIHPAGRGMKCTGVVVFVTGVCLGISCQGEDPNPFFLPEFPLSVTAEGEGTVAVTVDGKTIASDDMFAVGTTVALTATPAEGWGFQQWEGDLPPESEVDNPLTMTMDSDKDLTAVFVHQFSLTLDVDGEGSVEVVAADGTATSESVFNEGAELTLTAVPDEKWTFVGWNGDVLQQHAQDNPLTVFLDADTKLTAVFVRLYALTVNVDGEGTVARAPEENAFEAGTEVELTATASDGHLFDRWEGDVPEDNTEDNPLTIVVNAETELTAIFRELPLDGAWSGYTSQNREISFRVSNGGTTISDFSISYRVNTTFCTITGTSSWDEDESIWDNGGFWASAGSFLSTYVRISGDFLNATEAAGDAYVYIYDSWCASGSTSPDWTATWAGE